MSTIASTSSTTSYARSSSSVDRSGLTATDYESAALNPLLTRENDLQTELTTHKTKISAYQNMATLLQNLESAVTSLRNPDTAGDNVFNDRAATLHSSSSGVTASSILSATVASGTQVGTHTIVVSQVAAAQRIVGSSLSSLSASPFTTTGSITFGETGVAGKSSVTISVDSTTTLASLVSTINYSSDSTGVSAQVLTVSGGQYELMLTGSDGNSVISLSDTGSALSKVGLSATNTSSVSSTTGLGIVSDPASSYLEINGKTLTISSTDSLTTIASDISAAGAGVTATVNGDQLVITGSSTASSIDFTGSSGSVLASLGLATATASSLTVSADTITTDSISAVSTVGLGASGQLVIGSGTSLATISATSTDSLSSIAAAIDTYTSTTGVTASIRSGMLVLSNSSGSSISVSEDATGTSSGLMSSLGLSANGTNFSGSGTVLQQAQAAKVTIDNVAITRNSNNISDVLSGIDLTLTSASAGTTVSLGVSVDTSTVESSIDAMVTSYNTWRSFYLAQTATSSSTGGASSTATLFGDSTLRNAETSVENALSSLVLGNSLGGIGISLDSNNELTVDSGMLESALQNNLSGVESLFEYSAQVTDSNHLSSGALQLTGHGSASYNGLLTLSLTGATSGGVTVAGLTGAGLVTGDTLLGSTTGALTGIGTHLQGVNLQYSGSTIPVGSTVTYYVSLSQGIADQIYDSAYQVSDPTYGSLSSLISSLQTQDTNLTSQYNALDTRISTYKNYLLDQYGSLEASISMANEQASLMQTLIAYGSSSS